MDLKLFIKKYWKFALLIFIVLNVFTCISTCNKEFAESKPIANKKFAEFSIESLIKEIEFYKIEKKVYPSKLEDLGKTIASRYSDPYQFGESGPKSYIYYEKINDNEYYLFSKGKDGIPFTDDDIIFIPEEKYKKSGYRIP